MKLVVKRGPKKLGDAVRSRISCGTCKLATGLLMKEVQKGTQFDDIETKFVTLCVSFKVEIESVCRGIFEVFGPEVVPALNATQIGKYADFLFF